MIKGSCAPILLLARYFWYFFCLSSITVVNLNFLGVSIISISPQDIHSEISSNLFFPTHLLDATHSIRITFQLNSTFISGLKYFSLVESKLYHCFFKKEIIYSSHNLEINFHFLFISSKKLLSRYSRTVLYIQFTQLIKFSSSFFFDTQNFTNRGSRLSNFF